MKLTHNQTVRTLQIVNWKSGEKWWEIDPPSWIIWLIKK